MGRSILTRQLGRSLSSIGLILIPIVAVAGITLAVVMSSPESPSFEYLDAFPARNFTLLTTEGKNYSLKQDLDQGRVVMLDFMATWCKPCLETGKQLIILKEKYPSVSLVSITSSNEDNAVTLGNYSRFHGFDWTFLPYDPVTTPDLLIFYKADIYIPVLVFIDFGGLVRVIHLGTVEFSVMEAWIRGEYYDPRPVPP